MPRISPWIERLEKTLERKLERKLARYKLKIKGKIPVILVALYFYGVFVNSIRLGIAQTFPKPGAPPVESIWVWNPVLSYAALFTPQGLGITLFFVIMTCLFTKKGYKWLSGQKYDSDPRGFDILKDGTYGTGGWMKPMQMEKLL